MKAAAIVFAVLAAMATLATGPAPAADVGVSISIGQPGFYGQIDIGNQRPQVIYAQPVIIQRVAEPPPPLYLRVPPGHEKNWANHCAKYNACSRPVYFVNGDWYEREYVPYHRNGYDRERGAWRDDERGNGRDREHGRDRGDDHDHGRGRGRDKD